MSAPTGYSRLQIILHWVIAFLIFGAFFTHEEMHKALDERIASGIMPGLSDGTLHTMMGGTVFALVILRLIVRLRQGAPAAPEGNPPLLTKAAHWGHILIYVLMIGVPIGGMVAWFGGVEIVGSVHGIVGKAMMLIILGHALAAILHQALLSDGTLMRMVNPRR